MCGIAGILSKSDTISPLQLQLLAGKMANSMIHRGPNAGGVMLSPDGRAAFSHRRLSIIDVSDASAQPMSKDDSAQMLTYNGELYNFTDIRSQLEEKGTTFSTTGDTEVMLESLAAWNTGAFHKFDGMYAFGFYDAREKVLTIARDNFGEKPLYYVDTENYFAFASELHALTILPDFPSDVSQKAIAQYLSLQYIPAPDTIYDACKKLEPGCYLCLDQKNAVEIRRHYKFETSSDFQSQASIGELADELEELLEKSIRQRMVSDVPLGAFLSGGVDSSTVVAIAQKMRDKSLETYSIGFDGYANSEHFEAAETAKLLETQHFDKTLTANTTDLGLHIGTVLDEPNGDTSCLPTSILSEFAKQRVTVALSGDGGDELFGGYGRYFVTADEAEQHAEKPDELAWWSPSVAYFSSRLLVFDDPALIRLMGGVPKGYASQLARWRSDIDSSSAPIICKMREIDASGYMPGAVLSKVDRMSMQSSLEVRAPLLSRDIAQFCSKLAGNHCYDGKFGKIILREVAERYLPKEWMRRKKRGFGLPMDMWGAEQMLPTLKSLLLTEDCQLQKWLGSKNVAKFCQDMEKDFHAYRAWSVFILETWLRTHPCEPLGDIRSSNLSVSVPLFNRIKQKLTATH